MPQRAGHWDSNAGPLRDYGPTLLPVSLKLCTKGLAIKYILFFLLAITLLATPDAFGRGSPCVGECQALFREVSFGSPLIGMFYLIAPVFGVIVVFGKKVKTKKETAKVKSENIGNLFYLLAGIALIIILVV